jgi:hypothetical protein
VHSHSVVYISWPPAIELTIFDSIMSIGTHLFPDRSLVPCHGAHPRHPSFK